VGYFQNLFQILYGKGRANPAWELIRKKFKQAEFLHPFKISNIIIDDPMGSLPLPPPPETFFSPQARFRKSPELK
jgi:hypothetical protein